MKSPLVSVIVPVYNVERYLNRCLNSIISQTFKDIEIICVNDGSTDTSLKILKEYQKIDNRIIVINKENEGVSKSRNKGIEVAKGEYIVFVDSDDWINLDMVEYMYNKAKNTDTDIVMCTYMREYINNSKEKVFNLPDEIIFEDEAKRYLLYKSDIIDNDSINHFFEQVRYSRGIPNLSLLYYNNVISMKDIIRVRDNVAFGKFTSWLESHNYSVRDLQLALLDTHSNNRKIEKWFRWSIVSLVPSLLLSGMASTLAGIGMSFIEQLLPQFSGQEIPSLFFDEILSKQFNAAKMSKKLQAKFGF